MDSAENKRHKPRISVIIPTYNSGELLFESLNSVIAQDYPNLQIVICDDASAAFDAQKVEEFFNKKARQGLTLLVIIQPENIGTVKNLNEGIKNASGQWILLLAADDVLASDQVISSLYEQAIQTQMPWIISKTALCDKDLNIIAAPVPNQDVIHMLKHKNRKGVLIALAENCILPSSGLLYEIQFLKECGLFDEDYRLVEDWPFYLKVMRAGRMPGFCDQISVLHRAGGISGKNAAHNYLYQKDLVMTISKEILPYLLDFPQEIQHHLHTYCYDKLAVYEWRFQAKSFSAKMNWIIKNSGTLYRKVIKRK